jgi:hypothetical protein
MANVPNGNASATTMFAALISSLMLVALLTTLVLPGRQTPAVIREFFTGLSGATRAAIGIK